MNRLEVLEDLKGEKCAGCGEKKQPMRSFCRKCYYKLPPEKRQELYLRFENGYVDVFHAALDLLKGENNGNKK